MTPHIVGLYPSLSARFPDFAVRWSTQAIQAMIAVVFEIPWSFLWSRFAGPVLLRLTSQFRRLEWASPKKTHSSKDFVVVARFFTSHVSSDASWQLWIFSARVNTNSDVFRFSDQRALIVFDDQAQKTVTSMTGQCWCFNKLSTHLCISILMIMNVWHDIWLSDGQYNWL